MTGLPPAPEDDDGLAAEPPDGGSRAFLRRGVSASAVAAVGAAILGLVTTAFLARELGAAGYGAYAWALAWVFTLRIPALAGTDRLVTRDIGAHRAGTSAHEPADVVAWADRTVLLVAGAFVALVAPVALVLGRSEGDLTLSLAIAMPLLPVVTLLTLRQTALLADRRVLLGVLPDTLLRPVAFLAIVLTASLLSARITPEAALLVQMTAAVGALAVAVVATRRAFGVGTRARPPATWRRAGARIAVGNAVVAVSTHLDLVLVGVIRGPRDAGIYAVVSRATAVVNLPAIASLPPLSPVAAGLHAAGRVDELHRTVTRTTRAVFGLALLGCAAIAVAAEPLLHALTPGFEGGATGLQLLMASVAIANFAAFNTRILTLTGHEKPALRVSLVGAGAGLVVGLAAIPSLGVAGAALGAVARSLALNVAASAATWRHLGFDASVLGLRARA